jgi:hypothetical protein
MNQKNIVIFPSDLIKRSLGSRLYALRSPSERSVPTGYCSQAHPPRRLKRRTSALRRISGNFKSSSCCNHWITSPTDCSLLPPSAMPSGGPAGKRPRQFGLSGASGSSSLMMKRRDRFTSGNRVYRKQMPPRPAVRLAGAVALGRAGRLRRPRTSIVSPSMT